MALIATVTLRRGRYDASGRDDRYAEFIPSPFRLFCALVAVAGRNGDPRDHVGLRWLEQQAQPVVMRPPLLDSDRDETFFVTNRIARKGGSMNHPGRVNGLKHRSWVSFRGDRIHFLWLSSPPADVLSDLQELAGGVGYLGRIESTAVVDFAIGSEPEDRDLERFEPVPIGQGGHPVSTPFPGVVEELVAAHQRGASSWQVARWAEYAQPATVSDEVHLGPFRDLLVFQIEGRHVDGSHLLDLTSAFRAAVMSRIKDVVGPDAVLGAIHGHDGGDVRVAYLGLPFAGFEHADGGVRGLALALPRALVPEERSVILRALVGDDGSAFDHVVYHRARRDEVDGTRKLHVHHVVFPDAGPATLRPGRWMGGSRGASTWSTVTPAMLDRHPKGSVTAADVIASGLVRDGYPEPESVEVSPSSSVAGAVRYRGSKDLIRRRQARPLVHVTVRFPVSVVGPVLIGSLRYVGGGLCVPAETRARDGDRHERMEAGK